MNITKKLQTHLILLLILIIIWNFPAMTFILSYVCVCVCSPVSTAPLPSPEQLSGDCGPDVTPEYFLRSVIDRCKNKKGWIQSGPNVPVTESIDARCVQVPCVRSWWWAGSAWLSAWVWAGSWTEAFPYTWDPWLTSDGDTQHQKNSHS